MKIMRLHFHKPFIYSKGSRQELDFVEHPFSIVFFPANTYMSPEWGGITTSCHSPT